MNYPQRRAKPGIGGSVVGAVCRAVVRAGFPQELITARLGASTEVGAVLAGESTDRLLDEVGEHLGDPSLALKLPALLPIGALGPLDYAVCASATLREAVSRLSRFYPLMTQRAEVVLEERGPHATLSIVRITGAPPARAWIDLTLAMMATRMRETLAEAVSVDAVFKSPAPSSCDAHDRLFGAPARFGHTIDGLRFARSMLDRPLCTALPMLTALLDARLRELVPGLRLDPLVDRTRRAVAATLGGSTTDSIEVTASKLRMSARTLQRELKSRGTSYRALVDEVRRDRAMSLLEQRGTPLAAVSWELGFADPSAFFKAFRRWTGETPRGVTD